MPSQTFTHSARSDAPPSAIWDSLTRVETWEKIPGVDQVTSSRSDESGNLDAFTFIATIGGRPYRGTARLRDRVEPSRMAWDIDSPDVRGSIAVDLAPDDGGTTVTVALTVAVLTGLNADEYGDPHTSADRYADINSHADGNRYPNEYGDSHTDNDRYADTNSHADEYGDSHTSADCD